MWHWPICKKLDLSFIWGHHYLHLLMADHDRLTNWPTDQLITSLLATQWWRDPERSKQLSKVAVLGFQFKLCHVVVLSTVLRNNQSCIVTFLVVFYFWLYRSFTDPSYKPAKFSFAALCIIVLRLLSYWELRKSSIAFDCPRETNFYS